MITLQRTKRNLKICLSCRHYEHKRQDDHTIASFCKSKSGPKNYFESCENWQEENENKALQKLNLIHDKPVNIDICQGEKKFQCDNNCGNKAEMFIRFRSKTHQINLCLECLYILRKKLNEEEQ